MAVVEEGRGPEFDWIEGVGPECVQAVRDSSKPGRSGPERWVLHASPNWSRSHLEDEPEAVGQAMLAAFARVMPGVRLRWVSAHRWRFAHTLPNRQVVPLWDESLGLGLCGDAYREPGALGAWACGSETARQLLACHPSLDDGEPRSRRAFTG
jgi:predicted NAD/FAD-dependent oxidoreductase